MKHQILKSKVKELAHGNDEVTINKITGTHVGQGLSIDDSSLLQMS